jgi:hypothetical protein
MILKESIVLLFIFTNICYLPVQRRRKKNHGSLTIYLLGVFYVGEIGIFLSKILTMPCPVIFKYILMNNRNSCVARARLLVL